MAEETSLITERVSCSEVYCTPQSRYLYRLDWEIFRGYTILRRQRLPLGTRAFDFWNRSHIEVRGWTGRRFGTATENHCATIVEKKDALKIIIKDIKHFGG